MYGEDDLEELGEPEDIQENQEPEDNEDIEEPEEPERGPIEPMKSERIEV